MRYKCYAQDHTASGTINGAEYVWELVATFKDLEMAMAFIRWSVRKMRLWDNSYSWWLRPDGTREDKGTR